MTINKAAFQQVLTQLTSTWDSVTELSTDVDTADPDNSFGVAISSIFGNLSSIEAWANAAIEQVNQEEQQAVMNNFLMELKVVFDKYAASAEATQFESGYGTSYGEPGIGFILIASFDGVSSTKEIKKSVILSEDLV